MKWFLPMKKFWTDSPKKQKLKLIVMLLILGFVLLMFPTSEKKASNPPKQNMINEQSIPQRELESLLTDLTGNKVKVLIAYADSGKVDIVREESITTDTTLEKTEQKKDEKPVLDANKNIQIQNQLKPRIKGVCIFYFGPYQKETEEMLYRAAKGALGADLHTVEVIFKPNQTNPKP